MQIGDHHQPDARPELDLQIDQIDAISGCNSGQILDNSAGGRRQPGDQIEAGSLRQDPVSGAQQGAEQHDHSRRHAGRGDDLIWLQAISLADGFDGEVVAIGEDADIAR